MLAITDADDGIELNNPKIAIREIAPIENLWVKLFLYVAK